MEDDVLKLELAIATWLKQEGGEVTLDGDVLQELIKTAEESDDKPHLLEFENLREGKDLKIKLREVFRNE